jgi:two-component system, NarL family, nitrate/nitrite response regulator NarL
MNRVMVNLSANSSQRTLGPAEPTRAADDSRRLGTIRVLLADDHPVVRWGMTCCLAPHPELMVVGEAADGVAAVRKAKEFCADVVLMDIEMPELNGLSATEILRRENPEVKVLLLSMYSYTGHMTRILQSGARGFLLKNTPPAEVVAAILTVARGGTCFGADMARQVLNQFANTRGSAFDDKGLSQREREVLIGIAEGLGNKEIGALLGISARTVETHRTHVMQKLRIHSVAGLTRYAVGAGLVILKPSDDNGKVTPER